jgi:hypothetical protein
LDQENRQIKGLPFPNFPPPGQQHACWADHQDPPRADGVSGHDSLDGFAEPHHIADHHSAIGLKSRDCEGDAVFLVRQKR